MLNSRQARLRIPRQSREKIKRTEEGAQRSEPEELARESEYQLAIAYYDKGDAVEACEAFRTTSRAPPGKTPESLENRKDADRKKYEWAKGGGGGCAGL